MWRKKGNPAPTANVGRQQGIILTHGWSSSPVRSEDGHSSFNTKNKGVTIHSS